MNRKLDQKRSVLILVVLLALAIPMSIASEVTLSQGTEILQTGNDVIFEVEEDFNTSSLTAYEDSTNFGGVNFSILHSNVRNVTVNISEFNADAVNTEIVTDFKANATSGGTLTLNFSNLTERRRYIFNGDISLTRNSKDDGDVLYETTEYGSNKYKEFSLVAGQRESIIHNTPSPTDGDYEPNESFTISGHAEYDLSGDNVVGGNISILDNGNLMDSSLTDENGEYSFSLETPKTAGYHQIEANLSQHGITNTNSKEITVDSIFLENPNVETLKNDEGVIDIDDGGALNLSVKAYKNLDNDIGSISYTIHEDPESPPIASTFEEWAKLDNTTSRDETQVWYNQTPSLAEKNGIGLGNYTIKFRAQSELSDGTNIYAKENPEFNITIQDFDMNLATDQESYSGTNDERVNITGQVIKQPTGEPEPGIEVNITLYNTTSGASSQLDNVTTNSTGHYQFNYAFEEESGVRRIEATTEDSLGITGNESVEYTVTEIAVDDIMFSDSQDKHMYNVSSVVSDSRGITDHTCELNVSDGEGNKESYSMSIEDSYGDTTQALCEQPYISHKNNTGWSPTEELDARVIVGNGSAYASDTASRKLPNTPPEVTEFNLDEAVKSYSTDVEAVAKDPNEDEDEISECRVHYYPEDGGSYVEEGNLDTSYGYNDTARCTFAIDTSLEGIDQNEDVETQVEFEDKHGATDISENKTTSIESSLTFDATVRTLDGIGHDVEIEFRDNETGNVIERFSTNDGKISGIVSKGTYDIAFEIFNSEVELNNAVIDNTKEGTFVFEDNVGNRYKDNISKNWVSESTFIYAEDIDKNISYDDVTVRFNYSKDKERYVRPWVCSNWNDELGERQCAQETVPFSELPYEPAEDYGFDAGNTTVEADVDGLGGAYVLGYNDEWRQAWFWREEITIKGGEQNLHDYQVKVKIDTSEKILDGNLDSSCSDIRFYDTAQTQQLDHWMEPGTCDTNETEFWVEIPYIPANTEKTVFMYHDDREDVSSTSSGAETFIEFEEFNSEIGTDYVTRGTVETRNDQLLLSSKNSEEASATYVGSELEEPYRTHARIQVEDNESDAVLSTQIDNERSNSVSYSINEGLFEEDYTGQSGSKELENRGWIDLNQSVTSSSQKVRVNPGKDSITLNGDTPSGTYYPFGVNLTDNSENLKDMRIERWFATNYAESEPQVTDQITEKQWELSLNGSTRSINVQFNSTIDIKVDGSRYQSDINLFKDGSLLSDGDNLEDLTVRDDDLVENKTYEIRAEILDFGRTITHDITVGNDTLRPNTTNINSERIGTNKMNFTYEVKDNYQGYANCRIEIGEQVKASERVDMPLDGTWYNSYMIVDDAPHGENDYTLKCSDSSDNYKNKTRSYSEDFKAPEIDISHPNPGQEIWRVKPEINFSLTDDYTEDIDYEVYYGFDSDKRSRTNGTIQNDTLENVQLPEAGQYGDNTRLYITAEDDLNYSRTKSVRIDLYEPKINITYPNNQDGKQRTFFNPTKSGNREFLPATRHQTDEPEGNYTFYYKNDQMDTTTCRVMIEGKVAASDVVEANKYQHLDVTFEEGINQETRVECQTETGAYVPSDVKRVDADFTDPGISTVTFSEENNTAYGKDKEHKITAITEDNLETPKFSNVTITTGADYFTTCDEKTSTTSNPYLEINGSNDQVMMRHNVSGNMVNNTVNLAKERFIYSISMNFCRENTDTEPTRRAVKNFGTLGAGTYQFKYWVSDELNNTFESETKTYRVKQGDPSLNIYSRNERASDGVIVRDTNPAMRCSVGTDEVLATMYLNGSEVESTRSGETMEYNNDNISTGVYDFSCESPGNENYTADFVDRQIEVVSSMEDEVNISINNSFENKSYEFGDTIKLNASSRSDSESLFFDGLSVSNPYVVSPEVGTHEVFANSTGSYRFDKSSKTRTLNITRATNELDITSNRTIRTIKNKWKTPIGERISVARGSRPEITCESETAQSTTNITRDGTLVEQGMGTTSTVVNTSDIGEGNYNYVCSTNETDNYNPASKSIELDISIAPAPDFNNAPGGELNGFNFSGDTSERDIDRGTTLETTCDPVQNVPYTLYDYEGLAVNSLPDTATFDKTGNYDYECVTEQTEDYRSTEQTLTYDVMNRTSTDLFIDGSKNDLTIDQGEEVNLVADVNTSGTTALLRDNRTPGKNMWREEDGRAELNKEFQIPGVHNITAYHPEEDDYFPSRDWSLLTVRDVNAPEIDMIYPTDGYIWDNRKDDDNNREFDSRFEVSEYSDYTCTLSINGSFEGQRGSNGVDDTDKVGSKPVDRYRIRDVKRSSGVYEQKVSCSDEYGNTASKSIIFRLDNEYANATIHEPDRITTGIPDPEISVSTSDISTEHVVRIYKGAEINSGNEFTDPYLEGGTKIAQETIPEGPIEDIRIDPQAPGLYNISATVTDETGKTSLLHDMRNSSVDESDGPSLFQDQTELNISDNIAVLDPASRDERTYTNTTQPDLAFKYYSSDAPMECEVSVDGSKEETFTSVPEDEWRNYTPSSLSQGSHTWNVSCAGGQVTDQTQFWIDTEDPIIRNEYSSQSSGEPYTGDPITFGIEVDDNFEVEEVRFEAASEYTNKEMFCDDGNNCEVRHELKPGTHSYNYTACDEAGNCVTETGSTSFTVLDESESMNLYLNGVQDNITITEDPIVNISGEFVSPKEGTVYFYVNDTLSGSCERGSGCFIEENFLSPNGSYRVDAQFYSFTDSTTNNETFWINAQVPRGEWRGYYFNDLPSGKYASLKENPVFNLLLPREGIKPAKGKGASVSKDVLLGNDLGRDLAAQVQVEFGDDINGSDMKFDTNRTTGKSYLHLERDYPEVQRKDLLVPRNRNTGEVTVCPGAASLDEVSINCENGYNISTGETIDGVSMQEVEVEGQRYYEVSGVRGTGGQELTTSEDTSNPFDRNPRRANVTEIKTFDEYRDLSADSPARGYGGNITNANISGDQTTDDWAGIYGNVSGNINLGGIDILYTWPAEAKHVFASNGSVNWSAIQQADLTVVDDYFSMAGQSDSAVNTFNETTKLKLDNVNLSGTPSVKTYNGSEVPTWVTGALTDDDNTPVFAGKARNNDSTSFNGDISDYQMMLPTGGEGDNVVAYDMYIDLN